MLHRRAFSLAVFALAAVPTVAAAQSAPPPPQAPPARVGFELGFGLYGGEINCENENGEFCDGVTEAGGFDLHANYFFNPKLGLFVDIWPMIHTDDDWTFTHNIVAVGVKYRPVPILTLAGGLGSAQARLRYDIGPVEGEAETDVVGAVMVSAAVEVLRGRKFAVDLQARLGVGFYRDDENDNGEADVIGRNIGFGAAMTWF
jgi:hypothetical protein